MICLFVVVGFFGHILVFIDGIIYVCKQKLINDFRNNTIYSFHILINGYIGV